MDTSSENLFRLVLDILHNLLLLQKIHTAIGDVLRIWKRAPQGDVLAVDPEKKRKRWTEEENSFIQKELEEGKDTREIAKEMGLRASQLKNHIKYLQQLKSVSGDRRDDYEYDVEVVDIEKKRRRKRKRRNDSGGSDDDDSQKK